MPEPTDPDARLNELEIKSAFAEDLLERLNALVARQQEQIETLAREVVKLRGLVGDGGPQAARPASEELPPHY